MSESQSKPMADMSTEELVEAYNETPRPNIYGEELMRRLLEAIRSGRGYKEV
jgi:hypothetical protein